MVDGLWILIAYCRNDYRHIFLFGRRCRCFYDNGCCMVNNDYASSVDCIFDKQYLGFSGMAKITSYNKHHKTDAASGLNNRTRHLIGRQAILTEPISNGIGRINVDDSWWKVTCIEDMPIGTHIKVTAVHDMILTVEKV
jgi:membrane-bound ClpP family serine protease